MLKNLMTKLIMTTCHPTSKRDAFQLMMSHSKNRTYLPELVEENDRKKKVRNLVRDFLKSNGIGWSEEGAKVYGIRLINAVSECLLHIDGHHKTLAAQSCSVPS